MSGSHEYYFCFIFVRPLLQDSALITAILCSSQSLQADTQKIPKTTSRHLPSTAFPINFLPIILLFSAK